MGNLCNSDPEAREARRRNQEIERMNAHDARAMRTEVKLLMLGPGDSGKSTIIKQLKIIFLKGYTAEERKYALPTIHMNILNAIQQLVRGADQLGLTPSNTDHLDMIRNFTQDTAWSKDLVDPIKEVWSDEAIQAALQRRSEFQVDQSCAFFLDNIDRMAEDDYIPTENDIIMSRVRTTGIAEMAFDYGGLTFRMVDVGGQRNERRKWIHCFDDVTSVIFCVALSEYDQTLFEDDSKNRMHESLELFNDVWHEKSFQHTSIILFLNKLDLFQAKIKKVDLNICFEDYDGGCNEEPAIEFIKAKFLAIDDSETRSIYPHLTCATDTKNVKFVFDAVQAIILRRNVELTGMA